MLFNNLLLFLCIGVSSALEKRSTTSNATLCLTNNCLNAVESAGVKASVDCSSYELAVATTGTMCVYHLSACHLETLSPTWPRF
jgi:hypothetical protein